MEADLGLYSLQACQERDASALPSVDGLVENAVSQELRLAARYSRGVVLLQLALTLIVFPYVAIFQSASRMGFIDAGRHLGLQVLDCAILPHAFELIREVVEIAPRISRSYKSNLQPT